MRLKHTQLGVKVLSVPCFHIYGCRNYILTSKTTSKPIIYLSNHITMADAFYVSAAVINRRSYKTIKPIRYMTANKYLEMPFVGKIIFSLGGFYAKKPKNNKPYGIEGAKKFLSQGHSVLIFPQGGLAHKNGKGRLRTGASVIAQEYPDVVPVLLKSNEKKWPLKRIHVVVGKKFNASGMNIEEMMNRVWKLEKHIR